MQEAFDLNDHCPYSTFSRCISSINVILILHCSFFNEIEEVMELNFIFMELKNINCLEDYVTSQYLKLCFFYKSYIGPCRSDQFPCVITINYLQFVDVRNCFSRYIPNRILFSLSDEAFAVDFVKIYLDSFTCLCIVFHEFHVSAVNF